MTKTPQINTLTDIQKHFRTERQCIKYLEQVRWKDGPVSPFDKKSKVYKRKDGQYRCKNTGKNFTVRTGTMFEQTRIPLQKWYTAIFLFITAQKGLSSVQLAKQIGVTQKTAWFMLQRIRTQLGQTQPDMLYGIVEMDETFVGGKNKNRHLQNKAPRAKGRAFADKTPVLGMIERNGQVVVKVVPTTSQKSLTKHIIRHVSTEAIVCVDEWYGYNRLKHIYKSQTVDHGNGIYVTKNQLAGEGTGIGTNSSDKAYTNTIEAFWGNYCKRPIESTYNHISTRHMQLYFNEFAWRYNSGKTNGGRNGNGRNGNSRNGRFCEFETTIHRCATKTNWENITYQYQPWHGFCRC